MFEEVKKRRKKMAAAFRNEGSCLLLFYAVVRGLRFRKLRMPGSHFAPDLTYDRPLLLTPQFPRFRSPRALERRVRREVIGHRCQILTTPTPRRNQAADVTFGEGVADAARQFGDQ